LYTQALTERSLNELFQNHWTEVYSFAKSKTRNHHQAEDLTCETFIKAFLKFETYNPSQKFKNWIFTICKNTFLDTLRKQGNAVTYLEDQLYFEVNDTKPSPVDLLILKENYLNLLNKIGQLNKSDQEIINLFYLEDLSYEQITERLNISYANARTKLNRAKHKLREHLN
jgi:RNA polymerase sigma-70 factor (ECF subfamily)|tara:strand:+ start:3797 stop:4306 length:510 start_codon:yes stop_codon:yes gene_type:complete